MRDVAESIIPLIEQALNIKLYENQKIYLTGKNNTLTGCRRSGKTVAYCIKLALSDGEPLDIQRPEQYSDERGLMDHGRYSRLFFRNEFMNIRDALRRFGFQVRDVNNVRGELM